MIRKMAQINQQELKRKLEFVSQRVDALPRLVSAVQREFAKSPEGLEVKYLQDVVDHYLDSLENFLVHFISGSPGQRGIDHMVDGLEHPQSQIKTDKDLIKRLKKAADKLKKENLPDWDEWQHYELLKQDLIRLATMQDIHEFMTRFNEILVRATRYPQSEVSKMIMARSPKKTPKMLVLENLETIIAVWKLIFSRLYRPDQESIAQGIIGRQDFERAKQSMARSLKISMAELENGIRECLPNDREDNNWTNLKAFAESVVKQGKKNMFVRFFLAVGQNQSAELIINQFGKAGAVRTDPKTVELFGSVIRKLDSSSTKESAEKAAIDELGRSITGMLDRMKKGLEEKRDGLKVIISSRIKSLEKTHGRSLVELKGMRDRLTSVAKELTLNLVAGQNMDVKYTALQKSRADYYARASDIMAIMRARLLYIQFSRGFITKEQLDLGMNDVLSKKPSDFAVRLIGNLSALFAARMKGQIPVEDFEKRLKHIDGFIKKVEEQLPLIVAHQQNASHELARLDKVSKDIMFVVDLDTGRANKLAMEDMRKIGKMLPVEKYNLSPEDITILKRVA
jgi:hypothetical protein